MKVKIIVNIKRIGRFKADKKLVEQSPNLPESVKKTFQKYVKELDKYFMEKHRIKTSSKVEDIEI